MMVVIVAKRLPSLKFLFVFVKMPALPNSKNFLDKEVIPEGTH